MKKQYLLVAEDYDSEKIVTCEEHELEDEVMSFLKSELFIENDIVSVYEFLKTYNVHRDISLTIKEEKK